MNLEFLKTLDKDTLLLVINYLEGMPKDFVKLVKFHFNDQFLHPTLKGSKAGKYCTLTKFVDSKITPSFSPPIYQLHYNSIMKHIEESGLSSTSKYFLSALMNLECYDAKTLYETDKHISQHLRMNYCDEDSDTFIDIINNQIMPYKLKTIDIYSTLELRYDLNDYVDFNWFVSDLNKAILTTIHSNWSYTEMHDLKILFFLYCEYVRKDFSLEVLDRFYYEITSKKKDIEDEMDISSLFYGVDEIVKNNKTPEEIVKLLINNDFFIGQKINQNTKIKSNDGMLFFGSKYLDSLSNDEKNILAVKERYINENIIMNYVNNGIIKEANISFDINIDDLGHLNENPSVRFVFTAYDKYSKDMRYLCNVDNIYYILFKDIENPDKIFGLSLTEKSKSRRILEITKSKNYEFMYQPKN